VPPFLEHLTDGVTVANVKGNTVGECLEYFGNQFPRARKLLFGKGRALLGHIDIHVNGISTFPLELASPVKDGDTISMLYLIVGG
jgi:hypothetical protein